MKQGEYLRFAIHTGLASCLLLLLTACQTLPLEPSDGYPADWPKLIALSKGCPEVNGTYANKGTAKMADGSYLPITLESLIPRDSPSTRSDVSSGEKIREGLVGLMIVPPKKQPVWLAPLPILQATIGTGGATEVYEIQTYRYEGVMIYTLRSDSMKTPFGFGAGATRVLMTRGEDGSLIAKIHKEDVGMWIILPFFYSSEYIWARFDRIGN